MSIIVVGGHSRSVGKTSVVAELIAALSEMHWTALKITQYGHGICSANGKPCSCACDDHSWAITEENDRSGDSDSSRFLVAGALRSWWVRTEQGRLADAMPRVRQIIGDAENVIIESNSVLKFLDPDTYLTVIDPATADFKKSALQFLNRADAVLLHEAKNGKKHDAAGTIPITASTRTFRIDPPPYVTPEIVDFIKQRIT
jgi:hypothetical protein